MKEETTSSVDIMQERVRALRVRVHEAKIKGDGEEIGYLAERYGEMSKLLHDLKKKSGIVEDSYPRYDVVFGRTTKKYWVYDKWLECYIQIPDVYQQDIMSRVRDIDAKYMQRAEALGGYLTCDEIEEHEISLNGVVRDFNCLINRVGPKPLGYIPGQLSWLCCPAQIMYDEKFTP